MRRSIGIVLAVMIIGVIGWSMPAAGAAPSHVGNPCVKATASVEPHHVHVGDDLVFYGSVTGCGRPIYIQFRFIVTGPCEFGERHHEHVRATRYETIFFVTSTLACKGTYRATTEAYHDGQLIDRMSRREHIRT